MLCHASWFYEGQSVEEIEFVKNVGILFCQMWERFHNVADVVLARIIRISGAGGA